MEIYGVLRIRCGGVARRRVALWAWTGSCSGAYYARENITVPPHSWFQCETSSTEVPLLVAV
jgi:hypothetical protein